MPNEINDIVQVSITVESSAVSRQGFGTPLLVPPTAHAVFAGRTNLYTGGDILADLVTDGFSTSDESYLMAQSCLAQTPRPSRIKLGRADAGDADVTESATAIFAEDADSDTDTYIMAYGTRAEADILALSLLCETQQRLYVATSADVAITDETAGNVLEDLNGLGYRRTALFPHYPSSEDYLDAAMAGRASVADMDVRGGAITWANKALAGISPDTFTGAERAYIHGLNGNTYERRAGKNLVRNGQSVHGEFMDVQMSVDWLDSRLTEDILAALTGTTTKIPFDQSGIDTIETIVRKRLDIAVANGHLISYTIEIPKRNEIDSGDLASRLLRNVIFRGVLAGAIHTVQVVGRVSV